MKLRTERLILRRWLQTDLKPFSQINADPRVMEFMPTTLSSPESDALAARIEADFERNELGLCAVELRFDHSFIGFIGLSIPGFRAAFTPCVEIGWRLSVDQWGKGLATEGAREIVRYAFEILRLPSLMSFTTVANVRSRRIMEKLGMTHNPADDFDHPNLPARHVLSRHVLYKLKRQDWTERIKLNRDTNHSRLIIKMIGDAPAPSRKLSTIPLNDGLAQLTLP